MSNQNQHQTQNRTTSNETTPKSSPIQSAPTQSNPIQSNPIQLHIQPNFDSVKIKSLFYPAISRLVQTKPARASPPVRLRQNLLAMLPACKEQAAFQSQSHTRAASGTQPGPGLVLGTRKPTHVRRPLGLPPRYFSCQQNTSRLPKLQTKQQKHKQGQKYLCHPLLLDNLCTRKTKSI